MHVEVPQGREDFKEVRLPLSGSFGDIQHPKHFAFFHSVDITDLGEGEGVLAYGRLQSEEVHLQSPIVFQGNHLGHKVDHLLAPVPLVDELDQDKVVNLEK